MSQNGRKSPIISIDVNHIYMVEEVLRRQNHFSSIIINKQKKSEINVALLISCNLREFRVKIGFGWCIRWT